MTGTADRRPAPDATPTRAGARATARQHAPHTPTDPATPARGAQPVPAGDVIRAELAPDLTSARQARAAIRQALAQWGIDDPDRDAELLASELAANAAEHGGGPLSLALRRETEPGGAPGITCEISDRSQVVPRLHPPARLDAERGRGLAIVAALASASGTRTSETGKTTWFTLALRDRAARNARQLSVGFEPEAGT